MKKWSRPAWALTIKMATNTLVAIKKSHSVLHVTLYFGSSKSTIPDFFSHHPSASRVRKSAGDLLNPDWTWLQNYTGMQCAVNMQTPRPVYIGGMETLSPVYMSPHCTGTEWQWNECKCRKGRSVEGEAGGNLPLYSEYLEKLYMRNAMIIDIWSCVQLTCLCS